MLPIGYLFFSFVVQLRRDNRTMEVSVPIEDIGGRETTPTK
jgi:hypothetical protein